MISQHSQTGTQTVKVSQEEAMFAVGVAIVELQDFIDMRLDMRRGL
ncbi:hypothetical protein H6G25_15745 [Dolichospermum sp. FACHB-1091]|nr:hypothetical protein [Dolichospermum sp. FACHB-1091]MBD2444612.1 hypothetical protein [Dolichospermum sp. FACHB-1091]